MTAGFFRITAVALTATLSACAASTSSPRVATAQAAGSQVHVGTVRPSLDCGYDDDVFNVPDATKLPKDAFCSPL